MALHGDGTDRGELTRATAGAHLQTIEPSNDDDWRAMVDRVQTGLERIFDDDALRNALDGRRVGWLANATAVDTDFRHGVDRSIEEGIEVVRLFGPEHGLRGGAQDMIGVDSGIDVLTGLPVVSLYGHDEESLRPDTDQLDGLDVVLIDMQDIGSRYYTYAATAALMIDACQEAGVEAWVLDRPNPIRGDRVEGNVVAPEMRSFVGMYSIATRHGMTLGELCDLLARRHGWTDALRVVEMRGWSRSQWYDETGLPWVMPSPNMPTLDTATVYPGQCLLEGTNVSEARGTTRPFELFGAPWIDAVALAGELEAAELPGVGWRAVAFEPMFQKHAGETCCGVQLHITDRDAFQPLRTSLEVLAALRRVSPDEFRWREEAYEFVSDRLAIDLLLGDPLVRHALEDGMPVVELLAVLRSARKEFDQERRSCLRYDAGSGA